MRNNRGKIKKKKRKNKKLTLFLETREPSSWLLHEAPISLELFGRNGATTAVYRA